MATILATTPEVTKAVAKVRAFAEQPNNWRRIGDDEVIVVPGDRPAFTVEIPVGYTAVYSIDATLPGEGMRHLSVSVIGPDGQPKGVHPAAMSEIMELFGFGDDPRVGTLPGDPEWVVHALEPFAFPEPRQVGPERDTTLTGLLFPWKNDQPVLIHMLGVSPEVFYLPLFENADQLREVCGRANIEFESIKQVEDGAEFFSSIPPEIIIVANLRFTPEGKIRFTQVQR
jgi:hypothetical protein